MSLTAALGAATSSLRTIQVQLAVASSNVANADTDGYTVKSAKQTTVVNGGGGVGTTVSAITSKVDANLLRSIVAATSADGKASTTSDYLQQLADSLGTVASDATTSGDTLSTALSDVETALTELASTPESETLKSATVSAVAEAAVALQTASSDIQSLRADADRDIAASVETINDALTSIDALNDDIRRAQANGDSTADLEDQRMAQLRIVAAEMDVSYYVDDSGSMTVTTGSGVALVDGRAHLLEHDALGTVTSGTTYPSDFDGITVDGKDITGALSSGTLAALVELRDDTLPAIQDSYDALAVELRDTVNAIHNDGTATPAPQTLTGSVTGLSGTDSLSGSGTLRVAITDADGNTVASQDIDLSTIATVDDLVTALNSVSGLTASLGADGNLVLSASDSTTGVALSGGDVGGASVSSWFGLNDLLTGSGAADLTVRADIEADPSLLATGTLVATGTLAVGDPAVTSGSATIANALADAFRDNDYAGTAGDIVADVGSRNDSATSAATSKETTLNTLVSSFQSKYGVNVDEESARIEQLQNAYAASAKILSAVQSMFDSLLEAVG